MDPKKKMLTDFLKHHKSYEEALKDVIQPYYFDTTNRLKGHCSEEGTDRFFRRSQSGEDSQLEVHPENFKTSFNSNLKLTSLGYGSYVGEPNDIDDWL